MTKRAKPNRVDLQTKAQTYKFTLKDGETEFATVIVSAWDTLTDEQYGLLQGILLKRLRQTPHAAIGPFELEEGAFSDAVRVFETLVNPKPEIQTYPERRRARRSKETRRKRWRR
jgi:hypothetical protein